MEPFALIPCTIQTDEPKLPPITRAEIVKHLAGSSWRTIVIRDDGRLEVECSSASEAKSTKAKLERIYPARTFTLEQGWGDAYDLVTSTDEPTLGA